MHFVPVSTQAVSDISFTTRPAQFKHHEDTNDYLSLRSTMASGAARKTRERAANREAVLVPNPHLTGN